MSNLLKRNNKVIYFAQQGIQLNEPEVQHRQLENVEITAPRQWFTDSQRAFLKERYSPEELDSIESELSYAVQNLKKEHPEYSDEFILQQLGKYKFKDRVRKSSNWDGQTNPVFNTIKLAPDALPSTVSHELGHAFDDLFPRTEAEQSNLDMALPRENFELRDCYPIPFLLSKTLEQRSVLHGLRNNIAAQYSDLPLDQAIQTIPEDDLYNSLLKQAYIREAPAKLLRKHEKLSKKEFKAQLQKDRQVIKEIPLRYFGDPEVLKQVEEKGKELLKLQKRINLKGEGDDQTREYYNSLKKDYWSLIDKLQVNEDYKPSRKLEKAQEKFNEAKHRASDYYYILPELWMEPEYFQYLRDGLQTVASNNVKTNTFQV